AGWSRWDRQSRYPHRVGFRRTGAPWGAVLFRREEFRAGGFARAGGIAATVCGGPEGGPLEVRETPSRRVRVERNRPAPPIEPGCHRRRILHLALQDSQ